MANHTIIDLILTERELAEIKAWKALSGYKFYMFGYWAAAWVKFNRLLPSEFKSGNPFKDLVVMGQQDVDMRYLRDRHLQQEEGQ